MEQVAKLKRTRKLAPVLQSFRKIPENYCTGNLSIGHVWWLRELLFKKYIVQMGTVWCINTCHDVTDLANHGMVKNTKTWMSWEPNMTFLENRKILNLCLKWHILKSYCFVAEVTFKGMPKPALKMHPPNFIHSKIS